VSRIPPGTLEGYRAPLLIAGGFDHALSILGSWNASLRDLESAIPNIGPVPTLLIWGTRDGAVAPASAARLEQALSNCRTRMLPGVGHLPYEETPEIFNRAVEEFLLAEPTPR
jgi:pimeloyl-ACP methyl ester carboxylesterase